MPVKREVLAANERFYNAFNQKDLDLMKAVWHNGPGVACIHPGWEVLKGYDSIIHSWENIFLGPHNLEIKLSDIEVTESGGLVWVGCQENLFSMSLSGVQVSKVHATNLFKRVRQSWKMVLHHASSVPGAPRSGQIGIG
ncbi:MAG: nuclear transport factor 2 family protein [Nitrospinaceae bacterium]